jgi:signal transduction histidine kinase/ActR/RegA family two-component response regulator
VLAICVFALVGALSVSFGVFHWQDWRGDVRDCLDEHQMLARELAPQIAQAQESGDRRALAGVIAIAKGDPQVTQLIWSPIGGPAQVLLDRGGPAAPPAASESEARRFSGGWVSVIEPVGRAGRPVGALRLVADARAIDRKLTRNSVIGLELALIASLAVAPVVLVMTRRALAPLDALVLGMQALQQDHDFSRRVKVDTADEFGALTERFNGLVSELQAYDARLHATLAELTEARDVAEAATQMKSDFLANMSHEIRTPLNGVLGMATVMATRPLCDEQKQNLEVIRTSGEALLSVLNDVLDFSKIEAGRLELDPAPFEIADVVEAVQVVFGPLAAEKGLALEVSIAPAAAGRRLGDAARVRQVLFNMVSNAIKFTDCGSVRVRVAPQGDALCIEVEDTGAGIPPQMLERLFEKFVQGDSSATRRAGGTGLGLAICRELVELMGGQIELRSEVGRGSVFRLALPLPRVECRSSGGAEAIAQHDQSPVHLRRLRVLAADDNPVNRLVLRAMLDALGVDVEIVENGAEAVERWDAAARDLILMDIQMPVLDGLAAAQEIRGIEWARGLPRTRIVALSANAMRHQVESYLAGGMDDHLAKPLQPAELMRVLVEAAAAALEPAAEPRAQQAEA